MEITKKTVGITFCRTFLRWVVDTEKCVSPYWSKVVVYQKLWQTELTARCFKDLKQICLVGSSYARRTGLYIVGTFTKIHLFRRETQGRGSENVMWHSYAE